MTHSYMSYDVTGRLLAPVSDSKEHLLAQYVTAIHGTCPANDMDLDTESSPAEVEAKYESFYIFMYTYMYRFIFIRTYRYRCIQVRTQAIA